MLIAIIRHRQTQQGGFQNLLHVSRFNINMIPIYTATEQ